MRFQINQSKELLKAILVAEKRAVHHCRHLERKIKKNENRLSTCIINIS